MNLIRKIAAGGIAAAMLLSGMGKVEALSTSAVSACVMDADTGRVLYEKNAHEQRPIASITKIMTGLLACEYGQEAPERLKEVLRCSATASAEGGTSLYMAPGDKIRFLDCIYGCMLRSGNDAAMLLAETVGGEKAHFVELMNQKAQAVGMKETLFGNPNGLQDEGNHSTAYDMCLLGRCAMENRLFCQVVKTTYHEAEYGWKIENHNNKLLERDKRCIGIKTGYTRKAGRTLVSCFQDPETHQRIIICTLNDPCDREDHIKAADWAFERYPLRSLCQAQEPLGALTMAETGETYTLTAEKSLAWPLREEELGKVKLRLTLPENETELSFGKAVGRGTFFLDKAVIGETNLLVRSN